MKTFKKGDHAFVISRHNTDVRFSLNDQMANVGDMITIIEVDPDKRTVYCEGGHTWDIYDLKHFSKERRIQQLERELDILKSSQFNVGDWVVKDTHDFLFRITHINSNGDVLGYGFDIGDWLSADDESWCGITEIDRLATSYEVESALIKEAKRRGYKEGVTIKSAMNLAPVDINDLDYVFNRDSTGDDLSLGGCCIYMKGEWAEIIDQPTFFDWAVSHDDDSYSFYCKGHTPRSGVTYNKHMLERILYDLDRFNDDTTIKELKRELSKFVSIDLPF